MNNKVQVKNCRPFTMMHNDFLDYEGLNSKEKLVMIMLMRYDGTIFPSVSKLSKKIGLSERTVRYAIKSLEEKKFLSRQARYTADGGQLSNAYVITDDPSIWKSETSDELSEEISRQELEEMAEMLRLAGYSVQDPSSQKDEIESPAIPDATSEPLAESYDDLSLTSASSTEILPEDLSEEDLSEEDLSEEDLTKDLSDSFADMSSDADSKLFTSDAATLVERSISSKKADNFDSTSHSMDYSANYSMDYLYRYFNYDLIRSFKNPYGGLNFLENKHDLDILDTVFYVLYDMLNNSSSYVLIEQESVSQEDVKKALLSLTFDDIIGVIDTYTKQEQQETISDPVNWFRLALYKGTDPHIFDG